MPPFVERIGWAIVVWIVVALICLLAGLILNAIGTPPTSAVGGFLTQWAWAIGGLCGFIQLLRGGRPPLV